VPDESDFRGIIKISNDGQRIALRRGGNLREGVPVTELKSYLSETWVLLALLVVCFGTGVFGAVNWNDYVYPNVPQKNVVERDEAYDLRVAAYNRKLDEVGKSALVPFPVAVTLCLTGFFGAAVLLFVLIDRHQKAEGQAGRTTEASTGAAPPPDAEDPHSLPSSVGGYEPAGARS
jgi:hypothetical protein